MNDIRSIPLFTPPFPVPSLPILQFIPKPLPTTSSDRIFPPDEFWEDSKTVQVLCLALQQLHDIYDNFAVPPAPHPTPEHTIFFALQTNRLYHIKNHLQSLVENRHFSGVVITYPVGAGMPAHTDSIVSQPLELNDHAAAVAAAAALAGIGIEIDLRVFFDGKRLSNEKVKTWLGKTIQCSDPLTRYLPQVGEYVITLSYGLTFDYKLDGEIVTVGNERGVVMDANHVIHGVEPVQQPPFADSENYSNGDWRTKVRVGVVAWKGKENRSFLDEKEEVNLEGLILFGGDSDSDGDDEGNLDLF